MCTLRERSEERKRKAPERMRKRILKMFCSTTTSTSTTLYDVVLYCALIQHENHVWTVQKKKTLFLPEWMWKYWCERVLFAFIHSEMAVDGVPSSSTLSEEGSEMENGGNKSYHIIFIARLEKFHFKRARRQPRVIKFKNKKFTFTYNTQRARRCRRDEFSL